ncbi:uncharacterized protein LOC123210864 isoform X2 [Mangifera indica]|uniref:uncharacterized protein LOC123210864 isoform X2 n=1 Tax=Mangifera indica TaxID=29780 RepID=UPI001CF96442|nr:uncharacterized protein LOC123210864 isoform X2 [Mangifera indica]
MVTQFGMSIRSSLNSEASRAFVVLLTFLNFFPGFILTAVVTLDSIEIYTTHEWIPKSKPTVYFQCKGENKTILPDVKRANHIYSFNKEESWQPLTDFSGQKCKRCGFYEADMVKSDDVYDEWEFCPSDFAASKGKYTRDKKKEFKAAFLCLGCKPEASSCRFWQKKKREQEQAQFLKLFEDGDDIEDELSFGM